MDKVKRKRIVSRVLLVVSVILIAYLLAVVCNFVLAANQSAKNKIEFADDQASRFLAVQMAYAAGTAPQIDEQAFCGFDLDEAIASGVKVNELVYLATHNSYKQGLHKESYAFYNYLLAPFIGRDFNYGFDTLTEQLNMGIRSIELDVSKLVYEDGSFAIQCFHNYFLETNSTAINFEMALREIKFWSDYNSGHFPLFILIEPKPTLPFTQCKALDEAGFDALDAMLEDVFGSKLVDYQEFLNGSANAKELRETNNYPTLESMMGKVVFLLHDKAAAREFYYGRENMKMLPAVANNYVTRGKYTDIACFAIANNAKKTSMLEQFVADNYMVRTRIDVYPNFSAKNTESALSAGANILSTDFPPSINHLYPEHTASISDNPAVTVLLRRGG
ncbi:MAG TPA: Ca2+-dependent phosphoinositide-specific phospholipase C [Eubacteriales bacterium]|nr:Ca2+-dependent phosphoinositide-specific phospholipase C [Eubacteriales bacterium]